jgi:hypothetical protein
LKAARKALVLGSIPYTCVFNTCQYISTCPCTPRFWHNTCSHMSAPFGVHPQILAYERMLAAGLSGAAVVSADRGEVCAGEDVDRHCRGRVRRLWPGRGVGHDLVGGGGQLSRVTPPPPPVSPASALSTPPPPHPPHGSATDPSGQRCFETAPKRAHRRLTALKGPPRVSGARSWSHGRVCWLFSRGPRGLGSGRHGPASGAWLFHLRFGRFWGLRAALAWGGRRPPSSQTARTDPPGFRPKQAPSPLTGATSRFTIGYLSAGIGHAR